MRWAAQTLDTSDPTALPGLVRMAGLVRSVRTPEFAGVTFHEVHAKSALNRVPAVSRVPFEWTVNAMRGCVHSCTYCFARRTHEYLELDAGRDFDTQIVVKVNVAELLRRELFRPSWRRAPVALGTNTDPYQRPEGRYRLMPGIISALADSGTPFSILTKGTLLRRDLPLLVEARKQVPVSLAISLALIDPTLHDQFEPGTPTPRARLELIRAIRAAGFGCTVLVAPVMPELTDTDEALDELFGELSAAGATRVTVIPLHLRPGTKQWFLHNLERDRPELVPVYRRLYGNGAYLPKNYAQEVTERAHALRSRHRFDVIDDGFYVHRMPDGEPTAAEPSTEPALF